jgi:hypothetical protein
VTHAPSQILATLTEQHLMLRNRIVQCELLADDVDQGRASSRVLWDAVDALRQALDAHNRFEERTLKPMLREVDAFGEVRLERMYLEHQSEHLALDDRLHAGTTAMLRAALLELREHLADEEQLFVSPRVLRDDLVVLEPGS